MSEKIVQLNEEVIKVVLTIMNVPEFMVSFSQTLYSRSSIAYPSTLEAYELLVIDQQVCDKAFFDTALDEMCSRFLSIPNEEIESVLEALGAQHPAALIDHFKLYIDKIREFCQK